MLELLCIELWKVLCTHVLLCLRQIHLLVANISNSKYNFLPHVPNIYQKLYNSQNITISSQIGNHKLNICHHNDITLINKTVSYIPSFSR